MSLFSYIVGAVLIVVGLAGALVPAVPGIPLIMGGIWLIAAVDGYRHLGRWWLLGIGLVGVVGLTLDLVAGDRADAASWAGAQVANGDLATEIGLLKQQPGKDILAHGGAGFAQSLARLGLADEYRLVVHPVALGAGLSLFAELPKPLDLKLVSTSIFGSGVAVHVYRPA